MMSLGNILINIKTNMDISNLFFRTGINTTFNLSKKNLLTSFFFYFSILFFLKNSFFVLFYVIFLLQIEKYVENSFKI